MTGSVHERGEARRAHRPGRTPAYRLTPGTCAEVAPHTTADTHLPADRHTDIAETRKGE